jgi:hypothetical protein
VPLAGFGGYLGGMHSIVELEYERPINKIEAVWIERVGDLNDTGSNVVVRHSSKRPDLKLFAEAHSHHLKVWLSMFQVYEFVEVCGMNPYCVRTNNCHVFAIDLFNFCLDIETKDERLVRERDLPNQVLARVAKMMYFSASARSQRSVSNPTVGSSKGGSSS